MQRNNVPGSVKDELFHERQLFSPPNVFTILALMLSCAHGLKQNVPAIRLRLNLERPNAMLGL